MSKKSRTWGVILNAFIGFIEDNTPWMLCKKPPEQFVCGDTRIICKGPVQSQGYYKPGGESTAFLLSIFGSYKTMHIISSCFVQLSLHKIVNSRNVQVPTSLLNNKTKKKFSIGALNE